MYIQWRKWYLYIQWKNGFIQLLYENKPDNGHNTEMKCCIDHVGSVAFGIHDKWKQARFV